MARTLGTLITEARVLLQDVTPTVGGVYRYSDDDLMECINAALVETRTKRPDLFLPLGLRNPVPYYNAETDQSVAFPLDTQVYNAFVYYIVGRSELREDTFSDNSRAVTLMNKFVSQLMTVAS